MKRTVAIILALIMCLSFTACGDKGNKDNNSSNVSNIQAKQDVASGGQLSSFYGKTIDYSDPSIYNLDCMTSMGVWQTPKSNDESNKAAADLLEKIEANPDTLKPKSGGKYIYVATNGTDVQGNGMSADKPVKTIAYANLLASSGDVVVLKRGNVWRERVTGKEGVSYGAYGKGNKPTVLGSPENLALREWKKVGEDMYSVSVGAASNIGAIVFDFGKAVGSMKFDAEDVKENYDYHVKAGKLTIKCTDGNPGALYASAEINSNGSIFKINSNSKMQNIRLMFTGCHGVSMGTVENVEFDGLVIGYIGGQVQSGTTRLGNGIEIYGGCDNYTIKNCHIYQCYDAGITMQYTPAEGILEQNILFEDNLLEYSNYNIEYFNSGLTKNVLIKDNVIRYGGYGFGMHTRPDKNKGTNIEGRGTKLTENFVFKNNIIDHSKSFLVEGSGKDEANLPKFEGNKFMQLETSRVALWQGSNYGVKKYGLKAVTDILGDKTGTLYIYK